MPPTLKSAATSPKSQYISSDIAQTTGHPLWSVRYVVEKRGIKPVTRTGNLRVFSGYDADFIAAELGRIDGSRRAGKIHGVRRSRIVNHIGIPWASMGGEHRRKKGRRGQFKGRDALRQENRQVDAVVKQLGLSKHEQRLLHNDISGQDPSFEEMRQIAIEMFADARTK